MEGVMTYSEMEQLQDEEILEVNAAINYYHELQKEARKKASKGGK